MLNSDKTPAQPGAGAPSKPLSAVQLALFIALLACMAWSVVRHFLFHDESMLNALLLIVSFLLISAQSFLPWRCAAPLPAGS